MQPGVRYPEPPTPSFTAQGQGQQQVKMEVEPEKLVIQIPDQMRIAQPPPIVGAFIFGGPKAYHINQVLVTHKKPRWLSRVLAKWLLELHWVEAEPLTPGGPKCVKVGAHH